VYADVYAANRDNHDHDYQHHDDYEYDDDYARAAYTLICSPGGRSAGCPSSLRLDLGGGMS